MHPKSRHVIVSLSLSFQFKLKPTALMLIIFQFVMDVLLCQGGQSGYPTSHCPFKPFLRHEHNKPRHVIVSFSISFQFKLQPAALILIQFAMGVLLRQGGQS